MTESFPSTAAHRRSDSVWPLLVIGLALVIAPFSLRAVNAVAGVAAQNRSYLPSFETRSTRKAFRPQAIENLRYAHPEWSTAWRPVKTWRPAPRLAAEAAAVRALFTLILVLRSRTAFDFIYFQF